MLCQLGLECIPFHSVLFFSLYLKGNLEVSNAETFFIIRGVHIN